MLFYPVRFVGWRASRACAAGAASCRARSSRSPASCRAASAGRGSSPRARRRWAAIAVDKGIAKLGSPADFYQQLEPETIAEHILETPRDDIRERRRADHGARAPRALARPAAAGPRGRARAGAGAAARDRRAPSPTRSATNIDQLLDVKLMVIRRIEANPELANRIFLEVGRQGAALHHQLRLLLRLPARHPARSSSPRRVPHWWVLPIGGVIIGYVTNWLGDLDDLRAGRAADGSARSAARACSCAASPRSPTSTRGSSPTTSSRCATSATSCCTARARTARAR